MKCKSGYKKVKNKCMRKEISSGNSTYKTYSCGGGIGFFGLLTILFIGLKLTGFISWKWVWILSPLWIPFLLGVIIFILFLIIIWIVGIIKR